MDKKSPLACNLYLFSFGEFENVATFIEKNYLFSIYIIHLKKKNISNKPLIIPARKFFAQLENYIS